MVWCLQRLLWKWAKLGCVHATPERKCLYLTHPVTWLFFLLFWSIYWTNFLPSHIPGLFKKRNISRHITILVLAQWDKLCYNEEGRRIKKREKQWEKHRILSLKSQREQGDLNHEPLAKTGLPYIIPSVGVKCEVRCYKISKFPRAKQAPDMHTYLNSLKLPAAAKAWGRQSLPFKCAPKVNTWEKGWEKMRSKRLLSQLELTPSKYQGFLTLLPSHLSEQFHHPPCKGIQFNLDLIFPKSRSWDFLPIICDLLCSFQLLSGYLTFA